MDNQLHIVSKIDIPDAWIKDFQSGLNKNNIKFSYERLRFSAHFDGPVSEILVVIKENPYSIILAPALYDILKSGLKFLFKTIKKPQEKKSIIIEYKNNVGNKIRIIFPQTLKQGEIEKAIDKCLKILSLKQDKYFEQEQYVDKSNILPTVSFEYNQQSGEWELEDVRNRNNEMEDLMDRLRSELDA